MRRGKKLEAAMAKARREMGPTSADVRQGANSLSTLSEVEREVAEWAEKMHRKFLAAVSEEVFQARAREVRAEIAELSRVNRTHPLETALAMADAVNKRDMPEAEKKVVGALILVVAYQEFGARAVRKTP